MLCPLDYPEIQDAAPFIWSIDSVALGMLPFNSVILISRTLYLSPALHDRSLGTRVVAIHYCNTHKITLFDVHTPADYSTAATKDPANPHGTIDPQDNGMHVQQHILRPWPLHSRLLLLLLSVCGWPHGNDMLGLIGRIWRIIICDVIWEQRYENTVYHPLITYKPW